VPRDRGVELVRDHRGRLSLALYESNAPDVA
jgi:hypothetical protein